MGLLALCLALTVPPAARTPFYTKGEPREALVVRYMVEGGHWVLPKRASMEGITIASKPPFFHWLAALASKAHGRPTEWTVRAPSVVLGTAAVLSLWAVARAMLPGRAALIAAVVMATTFEWVRATCSARVDGVLAAFMTVALLLFHRALIRERFPRREAVAAYLCLACAVLTKGPVGVILPGLVVGVALLVQGKLRLVPRLRPLLGASLVLALAGGWYAAAWFLGGDAFVQKHLLKENVLRFLGSSDLNIGHTHPFWVYFPRLAVGFLPWTPMLVIAFVAALRSPARRDPRLQFPLVWFVVVFVFYSLASAKRSVYLLALYPAAALLVGWWWDRAVATAPAMSRRAAAVLRVAAIGIVAVLSVPLLVALLEGLGFAPLHALVPLLHPKDQANLPLVREALHTDLASAVIVLALIVGAAWAALASVLRARWLTAFVAATAFTTALWALVFGVFQPELARRRTLAPFMSRVSAEVDGQSVGFYAPTFDFAAAFYGPRGTDLWHPGKRPAPTYVLIWDQFLAELPPEERAPLEVLAKSAGTDPKGKRHLVLVRLRS